jgi:soluble lytic murein transglycosylase-like protein
MMAMNQSQNQIITQVLDGPVSQQTQRQLARIKAMNMDNNLAEELRQSQEQPQSQAQNLQQTKRRTFNLAAGSTIAAGVGTGKIFSPSELTAFKQKTGLFKTTNVNSAVPSLTEIPKGEIDFPMIYGASKLSASLMTDSNIQAAADAVSNQTTQEDGKSALSAGSEEFEALIVKVGQALGLEPALIKAVIKTESNFDEKAVSPAGAQGLMQLMPGTAKEMGVSDPFNPLENIWGGARYLKKMLDTYGGNINKALAAYNWGPGNYQRSGGKSLPKETRRYIEVVNRNYNNFKNATQTA